MECKFNNKNWCAIAWKSSGWFRRRKRYVFYKPSRWGPFLRKTYKLSSLIKKNQEIISSKYLPKRFFDLSNKRFDD